MKFTKKYLQNNNKCTITFQNFKLTVRYIILIEDIPSDKWVLIFKDYCR